MTGTATTVVLFQKIEELSEQVVEMNQRLKRIEEMLGSLTENIENVQETTKNMDEHISFVNGIYGQIKHPFHALMGAAGRFVGSETPDVERLTLQ